MKQRTSPGMKHFLALSAIIIIVIFLNGCAYNNQGSCTNDCRIGSTAPVYATPVYTAPVYTAPVYRRYMSPSLYHPYRGYGRGGPGFRLHMGGTVIIR